MDNGEHRQSFTKRQLRGAYRCTLAGMKLARHHHVGKTSHIMKNLIREDINMRNAAELDLVIPHVHHHQDNIIGTPELGTRLVDAVHHLIRFQRHVTIADVVTFTTAMTWRNVRNLKELSSDCGRISTRRRGVAADIGLIILSDKEDR